MFFGSAILEVIIGLAFVYFLFSLITSTLNEWIASVLQLRSKTLREGIQNLLHDPNAENLAQDFFEHPLVRGLYLHSKERFPSYIPSRTFARTLIDLVVPADLESGPRDWVVTYEKIMGKLSELDEQEGLGRTLRILISEAGVDIHKIRETAQTLRNLQQTRQQLLDYVNQASIEFADIEKATQALDKIKDIETTLKQTEEETMATLHQAQLNVETYFNESMDRVSGWYKRQIQSILIVIASILVLIFNVDSIAIAHNLVTDPTLRSSVVAMAEAYVDTVPEARIDSTKNSNNEPSATAVEKSSETLAFINELKVVVAETQLPIGWTTGVDMKIVWPQSGVEWLYKAIGLLFSIIAISQGAPFWFDTINKLVNIRMAGKRPEGEGDDRVKGMTG